MPGIHGFCCCSRLFKEKFITDVYHRFVLTFYDSLNNSSNISILRNTMTYDYKVCFDIMFTNLITFVQEQYVLIHEVLASFMATFQTYNNFKC